ncbi:hypothetical protein DYD21_16825 [Rhodohalobacter sp. SW132]|uniref:hypothetical protein n=1 Tax=Rhodohalobacter sp. SW132 TaxID=2293433 RepID=UPI000E2469A7|nr:hypothetical protein [Rhodohalobacter sp. SW132]REL24823.1 hypothetical protein DYD21_16825 [Rhodohalobacter sp. SW132]
MSLLNTLLFYLILAVIGLIIADYLGRKRQIGFHRSLFFSITLTPIFGLLITLFTKQSAKPTPNPSILKKIIGWSVIIFGISSITNIVPPYVLAYNLSISDHLGVILIRFLLSVGSIGYGTFLVARSNGKRYDHPSEGFSFY